MYRREYSNFVRPLSDETTNKLNSPSLNGDEAIKLYLEVVGNLQNSQQIKDINRNIETLPVDHTPKKYSNDTESTNLCLFNTVQNNDIGRLCKILDSWPEKLNIIDEFGWSLLMIACQANSIETAQELLKRGIDTSVRDKAGNSAQSLVIKSKNVILADILMQHSKQRSLKNETVTINKQRNKKLKQRYICEICDNKLYDDKEEHLSSTIHNINASKGRKAAVNFVIPESNKGFQLMLRFGWNKEDGLGPNGSGKKYPIKTVQKNDKIGLGHRKDKTVVLKDESLRQMNRNKMKNNQMNDRQREINFRRQFY
ncbi:unnamed protein product, partial [Brenthis ino]